MILFLRERTGFRACPANEYGSDSGRAVNELRNSGVKFFGLCEKGGVLYGYVPGRDFRELCRIMEKNGFNCQAFSRTGIISATKGYHKRVGLVIGLVLSVCVAAALSGRVTVIETGGSDSISRERLLPLLRDAGIYIGCDIGSVDLRKAERMILAMDKDIAWIGIRRTGSRVVVEVEAVHPYPEIQKKNTPCNIVAARDAQIKGVSVYNGMLIPMVGDGVKKGDIIVSGVVDTRFGRSYFVHAAGNITGVYTEKMTFSQSLEDTEKITVGQASARALSVFGKRFVYKREGEVTGEYEYSESEAPLTLGRLTFPIAIVDMSYELIGETPVTRTEEEARELLLARVSRYEENFFDDVNILDRQQQETLSGGVLTLSVTYTLEGEIGEESPIFAKYETFDRKSGQ